MTNAGSYLYRAAINGALDLLRSRRLLQRSRWKAPQRSLRKGREVHPRKNVSGRELGEFLRLAIAELAPRAAEMLRALPGRVGNREIAALMGTSQAVVLSAL